jgi:hypothetical protein
VKDSYPSNDVPGTDAHDGATGAEHPGVTSASPEVTAASTQDTEQLTDGNPGNHALADGVIATVDGHAAEHEDEKPAGVTAMVVAENELGKADDADGLSADATGAADNDQTEAVAEAGEDATVEEHPETGDVQLAAADAGLNFEHIEASMSGDHPETDGARVSNDDPQLTAEALLPQANSVEIDLGQFGENAAVPTPSQTQAASAPDESRNTKVDTACDMPPVSTPQILIDEPNHLVA